MYDEIVQYVRTVTRLSERFSQPFRDRFEHTMRVYAWARRIQRVEGGDLEIISLAVLFHDVGWDEHGPHAEISAAIAEEYLTNASFPEEKIERIASIVRNHSSKSRVVAALSLEDQIVMDADLLDEVGAISIAWDCMATAYEENPTYQKAYERIRRYFEKSKERGTLLKTNAGRRFYQERLEFIQNFMANFEYELGLSG
ncbi:MAG: HD domain-containing protein [Bacillota bacterium]